MDHFTCVPLLVLVFDILPTFAKLNPSECYKSKINQILFFIYKYAWPVVCITNVATMLVLSVTTS